MPKARSAPEARQWLGNLLVAWTFVSGLALVLASALYQRSGDPKVLIAWLGGPFLVGTVLFVCIGIFGLASRTRGHAPIEPADGPRSRHASIFKPR
ncbi:MAG TPA: hypothetical protein VHH36_02390 [Candidatus Thermoplasmatota archaeon]|nr:hypothetical protein [Candidatus Thermoplasmatota archaeon]